MLGTSVPDDAGVELDFDPQAVSFASQALKRDTLHIGFAPQCCYSKRSDPLKPVKNVGINLVHLFNRLLSVFERPTPADVRLISQKRVSDGIGVDGDLLFRL